MIHWQSVIGGLRNSRLVTIFLLALVLHLVVMPATLHGDLIYIWSVPSLIFSGVSDPYFYATSNFAQITDSTWDVYYPPFSFVVNAGWLEILRLFSSTLIGWLGQSRQHIFSLMNYSLNDYLGGKFVNNFNIGLLKTPNLVYEILIILGLIRLVDQPKKRKTLILWLVNPVVFYSAYMMGQIDLLTAVLVVWATVMAVKERRFVSLALLVMGAMVKVLPIVLIAPMAFLLGKSWKDRIGLIIYSVIIFIIFNLPFARDLARLRIAYFPPIMPGVADWSFRPDALAMIGKLIAASGVGLWLAYKIVRARTRIDSKYFPDIIGLILLLFFSAYRGALFNHYVVLMPFLVMFWIKGRKPVLKILIFSGLLFLTHIYTRPLQGELFTPMGVDWLTNFPSTRELVAPWFKYEHLSLLTGAILSGWMLMETVVRGKRLFKKNYE